MVKKYVQAGKKRELASIGVRFASYLLDSIFVFLLVLPLYIWYMMTIFSTAMSQPYNPMAVYSGANLIPLFTYYIGSFVVSILYFTLTLGSKKQSTIGMRILSIRAIRTNGQDISYGRAFLRRFGMIVSALGLYLGWLWIVIDKNRQGWHDKIADTYIVKK